jgi:hypothetical protein
MTYSKIVFFLVCCLSLNASATENKGTTADTGGIINTPHGPNRAVGPENVCSPGVTVIGLTDVKGRKLEDNTCDMTLDANFAQTLREDVPRCIKEAAVKIYGKVPVRIELYQIGAYNVRKINTPSNAGKTDAQKTDKWSKHSTGQAMDFEGVGMDFGDDSRITKVQFTKDTNNQPFYDVFRDCWDKTERTTVSGKTCKTCSIGHPHTHPFSNVLHNDHMHFSLDCRPPSQPNVAGC